MKLIWKKRLIILTGMCMILGMTACDNAVTAKLLGEKTSKNETTEKVATAGTADSMETTSEAATEIATEVLTEESTEDELTVVRETYKSIEVGVEDEDYPDAYIEQVDVCKPEVSAWLYTDGLDENLIQSEDMSNLSFQLDGNELTDVKVEETSEKINYYILVDVSKNISDEYFEAVKACLTEKENELSEHGNVSLYSVGNNVTQLNGEFVGEIGKLEKTGDKTALNNALYKIGEDITEWKNKNMTDVISDTRNVVLLFSDGYYDRDNDNDDNKNFDNAIKEIKKSGASVFFFKDDNGKTDAGKEQSQQDTSDKIKNELADKSVGGYAYRCDESEDDTEEQSDDDGNKYTVDKAIDKVLNHISSAKRITGSLPDGDNNAKDTDEEYEISLKIYDDSNEITYKYQPRTATSDGRYEPSDASPEMEKGYPKLIKSKNQIQIKFKTSVEGADDKNIYSITCKNNDKVKVNVTKAESEDDGGLTYTLTLDTLYKGTYALEIAKNRITSLAVDEDGKHMKLKKLEYTFEVTYGEEYVEDVPKPSFIERFWWVIVLACVVLFLGAILIIYSSIKRHKGVVVIDDKMVLPSNVEEKYVVQMEQAKPGKDIQLFLSTSGKVVKTIHTKVNGSLMVGRDPEQTDLSIEDSMMSRQHFVLEYDGESFYITDLNSTNGTSLNGVRIKRKRRLENNDRITVGSMDITIRW